MYFLQNLFSEAFVPHGHCYLWNPGLLWLHIISDSAIAFAYFSIPLTLVYFVRKREDLPFNWIFLLFGSFIVACGTTHLLEIWTLWHPTYWFSGLIKAATAIVSIYTASELVPLVPKALALPSPAQLEAANQELLYQISERKLAESALQKVNQELEMRVEERTIELTEINKKLQTEIEERKEAEIALQQVNVEVQRSQKMLQLVMDLIPQSIWWKDCDSKFLGCNRNFAQMTGVGTPDNIIGKTDYDVWTKPEADFFVSLHTRVIAQNQAEYRVVEPFCQQDGTFTWLETNKIPLYDQQGLIVGTLGTAQDISDRKRAEEEIKASLQEKEVLLQEVHHRVKNNLQVIDSLFRHQCRRIEDQQTITILQECQNRVKSMALLHENLYQSEDLSKIDFDNYVRSLVANLFNTYSSDSKFISKKIDVANIYLDIETALPCGLIINELISNSLKYGFPTKNKKDEIKVSFSLNSANKFVLIVKDNGIGISEKVNFDTTQSLGLKLVKILVKQLNATIDVEVNNGTKFIIEFKELPDQL